MKLMKKEFIANLLILFAFCFLYMGNVRAAELEGQGSPMENGMGEIAAEEFNASTPAISNIYIDNANRKKGTFDIHAEGVQNGEYVKRVQFAVWSEVNGQDDIIWYDAVSDGNGGYTRSVNISSHKFSLGTYQIHTYVIDLFGNQIAVGKTSQNMEYDRGTVSVDKGEKDYTYTINLSGIVVPGGVTEVQIPVWSEVNGQDDIRWYQAQKTGEDSYQVKISLRNHKGLGKYNVHAYAKTRGGELIGMGTENFSVEEPKLGKISIENYDEEKGTFQIVISDIENAESIRQIQVPTWSKANGQDDIRWYQAKRSEQGQYTVNINIKDHKYSLGEYFSHVYITDITGYLYGAGAITHNIETKGGKLTVTQHEKSGYQYVIELHDFSVPGGVAAIQFPVWSEVNGQDDIRWYNAKKIGENSYEMKISLKNHKGFGKYNVHVYAKTKGGELVGMGAESFSVEEPKVGKISIENYDKTKGTYQVLVSDVENGELIQNIRIPTWSKVNGQDDICWYQAKKNEQGQYTVDVNVKDHKYSLGEYISHVYITDITGYLYGAGSVTHNIEMEKGTLTVTQDNRNKHQYIIELKDFSVPGGAAAVQFPIWSAPGGQDDIVWYTANRQIDGTYRLEISVKNHKGLGTFHVHAYARMPGGILHGIGTTSFDIKAPVIGTMKVSNEKKMKGEFRVEITDIENDELIQKIQVPIWSEKNQGDIVWYTAQKDAKGDYYVDVNINRHKYNVAEYNIHLYLTDITGVTQAVNKKEVCDMRAEYSSLEAVDIDGTEKTYSVTLSDLEVPIGEKGVSFAVWGETSGQNDIRWYPGKKGSDGKYSCTVNIRDHRELGTYQVHAYCTTKANVMCGIGITTFSVEKTPTSVVSISELDGTKGSFKVTASGVAAPSGVEKVQIPVWCANNQSDIMWYEAHKIAEGTYEVNVKVANHAHHFGNYKAHIYVTMGNGIMAIAGRIDTDIAPQNYVYNIRLNSMQCEVGVMGATADRVQFPTWSKANGQDDIIWYEGVNCGNGKWNAVVNSMSHKSAGEYITHVYTTDSTGKMEKIGETTYSLDRLPPDQSAMQNRANLYGSPTPFLILVNKSTHKVGIFQGWQGNWNMIAYWDCADGAPSTPTVEGIFSVGSRGYYFDAYGCRQYWWTQFYGAYLFHSVIYTKQGQLYDGRLGMGLSHGCVRLQIDNAKWIYDTIPSGTTVVVYR